jgi:2-iminoacetate synthase ThiH|tara:strand:+ start:52 stop:228 length:177 start_codon:yes stop_codon:yes gene_type:complete
MARKTVTEVSAHIERHEAVCTERWLETINRIKRLEFFVIATLVTLLLSAGAILAEQLF